MKTFRLIGMALFAVLLCVNFAACSSDNDDDETGAGGIVTGGKKLTKIVGKSGDGASTETYTFRYDNQGRLVAATESYNDEGYSSSDTYEFIWGDDAIRVTERSTYNGSSSAYTENYTIYLRNGLVQSEEYDDDDDMGTYSYYSSNRFKKFSGGDYTSEEAIWDGDKLVSVSDDENDGSLTYGKTCQKGYFPFIASIIDAGECEALFMAHPEIAGMRTNQLPISITWIYTDYYSGRTEEETATMSYEFDKEGYITKIITTEVDTYTYTLTWE